jgi:hypothetical protein
MKLSRRGKRTKRTKRTKRFKLKRNTKRHLNKYKRKNTYRKRSRKLRKNKRVMRGGEGNVVLDLVNNKVELEYTTSDRFSKFKNFFGSLQKGTFTVSLHLDKGYTISETSHDTKKMKDTLDYALETANRNISGGEIMFNTSFIPDTPDTYNFTLIMIKDDKVFKVKFVVRVKKYKFLLFKIENSESYDFDFDFPVLGSDSNIANINNPEGEGFTYSSDENFLKFDPYKDDTFTIVQGETEKKYTFPMKYITTTNNSFFGTIYTKMIKKILDVYKVKMLAVLNQSQQPPQHNASEGNSRLEPSVPVSMDGEQQQPQQQEQLTASG